MEYISDVDIFNIPSEHVDDNSIKNMSEMQLNDVNTEDHVNESEKMMTENSDKIEGNVEQLDTNSTATPEKNLEHVDETEQMLTENSDKIEEKVEQLDTNAITTPEENVEQLEANATPTTEENIEQLEANTTTTEEESIHSVSYDWSRTPILLTTATDEYKPSDYCENFTKGCQWSPDGTCLLVPCEDFRCRIYDLPRELYTGKIPTTLPLPSLKPALTIKDGGLIYDCSWYPLMNSWEPPTCCFISTSKETPVHLWDAFTGRLRATYRAYNQ